MRGNLLSRRFYVADPVLATYSHLAFACAALAMLCGAMPALILPLIEAATLWPPRGALMGLDLGTKPIGVAFPDPDRGRATGVEPIARKIFTADAARLLAIAQE